MEITTEHLLMIIGAKETEIFSLKKQLADARGLLEKLTPAPEPTET